MAKRFCSSVVSGSLGVSTTVPSQAHAGEAGPDLVHDAVEHGGHHHQREDAEHEQRQGEDRAQLVRPQLDQAAA